MAPTIQLPPEIRNMIYAELFTFSEPLEILRSRNGRFAAGHMHLDPFVQGSSDPDNVFISFSWSGTFSLVGTSATPLLQVSKATSAEARAVLYSTNTFALDLRHMYGRRSVEQAHFADLVEAIGAANAALVRRGTTSLLGGALFVNGVGWVGGAAAWMTVGGAAAWRTAGARAAARLCERFPALEVLDMHLVPADLPGVLPSIGVPGMHGHNTTNRMVLMSPLGGRPRPPLPQPVENGSHPPSEQEWARSYHYHEFVRRMATGRAETVFADFDVAVAAVQEAITGFAEVLQPREGRQLAIRTAMREATAGDLQLDTETIVFLNALVVAAQSEGWEEIGTVHRIAPDEEEEYDDDLEEEIEEVAGLLP